MRETTRKRRRDESEGTEKNVKWKAKVIGEFASTIQNVSTDIIKIMFI